MIPIKERKPEANKYVLAVQDDGQRKMLIIAVYHERFSIIAGDDTQAYEYSSEHDAYYLCEGWYEQQVNWGEYASIAVNGEITHWMPLPEITND